MEKKKINQEACYSDSNEVKGSWGAQVMKTDMEMKGQFWNVPQREVWQELVTNQRQ